MLRVPCLVVAVAALGAVPSGAGAQRFEVGRLPPGIRIDVDEDPYTIEGSSAQEIYEQLELRSPGGSWVSFPFFFLWTPTYEELSLSLRSDQGSGRCRVERFEARTDLRAVYPVWEPPPDAPEDLIAAWTAFEELVEGLWTRRRTAIVEFFTELGRDVRRVEALCGTIRIDVENLLDRRVEEFTAAQQLAWQEPGARLRWPPDGFPVRSAAASTRAAPPAPPEPSEPSRRSGVLPVGATEYDGPSSVDQAMGLDRANGVSGLVGGLIHGGDLRYLEAIDAETGAGTDALAIETTTEFRGLSPVLVATLVHALASRGTIDLTAPIATYLPDVDASVGRVTVEQLLAHRSGIDSAAPREGQSWEGATAALDERALFTEPEAVFSYSPYNDLLAIDVVEAVLDVPIADALEQALLRPLGMSATSVTGRVAGMPALRTNAVDVFQFLISWMNGELSGAPELPRAVEEDALASGARPVLRGGVWYDRVGGHPRISLTCDRSGFRLFPATSSIFVAWGRGGWPAHTSGFLLDELGDELGIGAEILRPMDVTGAARTPPAVQCPEPPGLRHVVTEAGPDAPAGDWAGRYVNGERYVDLEDRGGFLKVPGENVLDVGHYGGDVYFGSLQGRPILYLQLHRDSAGRRYATLDGRAYIHEEDRPDLGSP